jgi:hypothetical protein
MTDKPITLTADEAISALTGHEIVHRYANPAAGAFIGCDLTREEAENDIRAAVALEIGGPGCRGMKHGLVVWPTKTKLYFYEADETKLAALEAQKQEDQP